MLRFCCGVLVLAFLLPLPLSAQSTSSQSFLPADVLTSGDDDPVMDDSALVTVDGERWMIEHDVLGAFVVWWVMNGWRR